MGKCDRIVKSHDTSSFESIRLTKKPLIVEKYDKKVRLEIDVCGGSENSLLGEVKFELACQMAMMPAMAHENVTVLCV